MSEPDRIPTKSELEARLANPEQTANEVALSVILPLRHGLEGIDDLLASLLPQAEATGTEVLLVGPIADDVEPPARVVRTADGDLYRLRLAGIEAARGAIVAIGEDHAIPRPDWCEAIIGAHRERPETAAVAGCLVNATDRTLSGRSNFLAFAAAFAPPLAEPPDRPPPCSAVTVKARALSESLGRPGHFEAVLIPRLMREGRLAFDERIVSDHYQDNGLRWSIANAYHSARASYGYARGELGARARVSGAWWSALNWPRLLYREAQPHATARLDLAVVRVLAVAAGLGGAVGVLAGPGRSPRKVA